MAPISVTLTGPCGHDVVGLASGQINLNPSIALRWSKLQGVLTSLCAILGLTDSQVNPKSGLGIMDCGFCAEDIFHGFSHAVGRR